MFFALPSAFIVGEEEQAILAHRTADGSAEDIAIELERLVGLAVEKFGGLDQVVVGAGGGVAQIFIDRAVKLVAPTLGDQCDLCARSLTLISSVVGGGDAEFLNRIQSHWQHGFEGVTLGLVIDVDSVEGEVALVAARAVYRAVASVLVVVNVGAVARVSDARLQA